MTPTPNKSSPDQREHQGSGLAPTSTQTNPSVSKTAAKEKVSLVPLGITIGLALFALVLSLAGYGVRLALGEEPATVLKQAGVLVPAFVLGIPLLFWLGSLLMNKVTGSKVQRRNALTLGWLTACVAMLWLMGTNS